MKILNRLIFTHIFSFMCLLLEWIINKNHWDNQAWGLLYFGMAAYCIITILICVYEKFFSAAEKRNTDIPPYYRMAANTSCVLICAAVVLMDLCVSRGEGNIYAFICFLVFIAASGKLIAVKCGIMGKNKKGDTNSI